jgi:hypothetical protein
MRWACLFGAVMLAVSVYAVPACRRATNNDVVDVVLVVNPAYRGLIEFNDGAEKLAAHRVVLSPNAEGSVLMPQPNPLFGWHRLKVQTTNGIDIPVIEDLEAVGDWSVMPEVVSAVSGTVSNSRVFLLIESKSRIREFDERVRDRLVSQGTKSGP